MNATNYVTEFYGPTLLWYSPIFGTMGVLAVIGNLLLIWIALSTPSIRSVNSNWFVIGMGISEFLFGFNNSVISWIAYVCGRDKSCPLLVKFCSAVTISIVESSLGE